MSDATDSSGLRRRIQNSGEDALGKLVQDLLDNPLIHGAITRAMEARERASQAQEVAMGALNIPSAGDIARLTRRVRAVSQRLEGVEDGIDRVDQRLAALGSVRGMEQRLTVIEERLDGIARQLELIRRTLPGAESPVPGNQERLQVSAG